MKTFLRTHRAMSAIIVLAALILLPGHPAALGEDTYASLSKNIDVFGNVYKKIVSDYVRDVDPTVTMNAGIHAMLGQLDPHSQLFEAHRLDDLKQKTTGKYGGLGITIYPSVIDRIPTVLSPIEGTPAELVGLRPGDRIVKIEGEPTLGMSMDEILVRLRGEPGSAVTISIGREGETAIVDYMIIRGEIDIKSVTYAELIEDGIGYVRLVRFSEATTQELANALAALIGRGMTHLILDVRGNPGGLLSQAVAVADLFLPRGQPIVAIRGRESNGVQQLVAQKSPSFGDGPMIVLTDEGSASASEIVAGAVQDADRGLIVGQTTFGKGSVQTVFPVGDQIALKLTTAYYHTPSGRNIHRMEERADERDELALAQPDTASEETAHEFHTARGRIVYGGGGVAPDVEVAPPRQTRLVRELLRTRMFFSFAVAFGAQHPQLEEAEINDTLIGEFRAFLADSTHGFDYKGEGENHVEALERLAEENQYGSDVHNRIASLREALRGAFDAEFRQSLPAIKMNLRTWLAFRDGGDKARTVARFPEDAQLQEALRIMRDPHHYAEAMTIGPSIATP